MHLKPTEGCQISILIFEKKLWRRGVSINIPYKYIKDGKVLAYVGLSLKILPWSLTDFSA